MVVLVDHSAVSGLLAAATHLISAGYVVATLRPGSGEEARRTTALRADLVVLNLDALGTAGFATMARLQRAAPQLPVVLVQHNAGELERIRGLAAGADDVLPWPISPVELTARVRAVLRRTLPARRAQAPSLLRAGPLLLDEAERRVEVAAVPVQLTLREFELLAYLMRHPRQALRRQALLEAVWGYTFGDTSTVTVHIRRVRAKLEPQPSRPTAIRTVWGVGYLFDPLGPTNWERIGSERGIAIGKLPSGSAVKGSACSQMRDSVGSG